MKVKVYCTTCKEPHYNHDECDKCHNHLHGTYRCGGCRKLEEKFCPYCGEPFDKKDNNKFCTYIVQYEKYPNIWVTERFEIEKSFAINYLKEIRKEHPENIYRLSREYRVVEDI